MRRQSEQRLGQRTWLSRHAARLGTDKQHSQRILTGKDGDPQMERQRCELPPHVQGPPRLELGTVSVSLWPLLSSHPHSHLHGVPRPETFLSFSVPSVKKSVLHLLCYCFFLSPTSEYISLPPDFWIRISILIGSHSYCPLTNNLWENMNGNEGVSGPVSL